MTAVRHDFDLSDGDLNWRARLTAAAREFWHAMRAAHHARIPS